MFITKVLNKNLMHEIMSIKILDIQILSNVYNEFAFQSRRHNQDLDLQACIVYCSLLSKCVCLGGAEGGGYAIVHACLEK